MTADGNLTISEAARRLGLQDCTLRSWVLKRKINYLKVGGRVWIEGREVDRILKAARVPAKKEVALGVQ